MKKRLAHKRRKASSALVIVLLGIVLLTIIAFAFMQTMSIALTTSKSYADIERATLAAQGGLDTAIAQIAVATGTNLAFVTGQTSYPTADYPFTVIGAQNLTNQDQMMPLVSGPFQFLTNFNDPGFSNNFQTYLSGRTSPSATSNVDVNTPYQFIQVTDNTNYYRASWVTMTNSVGTHTNYARYAYVVLDDSARVNPMLMTGAGGTTNGFVNATNWYGGPQDITLTNSSAQLLTPGQEQQIMTATNAATNSFTYSDATLGETFASRTDYEAVKHLFTSQTNASFDVIPGWLPDGGKPKYNINDLATNSVYGGTASARALNIATIISRNLPSFYQRDTALSGTNQTLYVQRVAANIADYINQDGAFQAANNPAQVFPQGKGVFPISIAEQITALSGGESTAAHSSATVSSTFWLNCWNPFTTPVTITSATLQVSNLPAYSLGGSSPVTTPNYNEPLALVSDSEGKQSSPAISGLVVGPNEYVVLGFKAVTETISGRSTTDGPTTSVTTFPPCTQYSLTVNGQIVAQSQNMGDGLEASSVEVPESPTNTWWITDFSNNGSGVADPRFLVYYATIWNAEDENKYTDTPYKGRSNFGSGGPGSRNWEPLNSWVVRDNLARNSTPGKAATGTSQLPDAIVSTYSVSDASAAPCVIRNGPMVSIGELGHVADPAYAADDLSTSNTCLPNVALPYSGDAGNPLYKYYSPLQVGGARSLRIGRPESTGATNASGSPTSFTWDKDGERGIDLVDLFTVNNTNLATGGVMGRINPNTASTNVIAALLSGIKIDSDTGMGGTATLTNLPGLAEQMVTNRPYSSLSDLYKFMPNLDAMTNYALNSTNFSTNASGYLDVVNRVHQEAFGKLIQHLTVQSRAYRIYVIGQVLDNFQNPRGSVAMEAGVNLQYDATDARYVPVLQYVRLLK